MTKLTASQKQHIRNLAQSSENADDLIAYVDDLLEQNTNNLQDDFGLIETQPIPDLFTKHLSPQHFDFIMDNIDEVIFVYDINHRIFEYISPAFQKIWMRSPEVLYENPQKYRQFLHPDDEPQLSRMGRLFLTAGTGSFDLIFRIIRPDQSQRHVHTRAYQVYNPGVKDDSRWLIGIVSDITDKQVVDTAPLRYDREKERMKVLSDFIRDASHEFKTPLSILQTSLYLMSRTDDEAKRDYHVSKINGQVQRLITLVESLITMTRLDFDPRVQLTTFDLNSIIRQVITSLHHKIIEKEIEILFESKAHHIQVTGSEHDVFIAIQKLIDNAVRYSQANQPVVIQSLQTTQRAIIEIHDHGAGITDEQLPYIFDRFYRGDTAHETPGIGLGLSIAQRVAEMHNGRIDVYRSSNGAGTTFKLMLPLAT